MPRAEMLFLLLLLCFPILLFTQEGTTEPDWDYYYDDGYTRGDQTFTITLGTIFPTFFFDSNWKILENKFKPPVGGTGSLSYNYFINKGFYIGGEVGLQFIHTLGDNTLLSIPLAARGGYQFSVRKLEIPTGLSVGMVWHRLLDSIHYGMYAKAGTGVYYRFFTNWSFGINANWYWFPQWTGDKKTNVQGNMADASLSARYHF